MVGLALLLRSLNLEIKPVHFDEGINGNFVAQMWKTGYYTYDPSNFHGPLYFYFLQLAEALFGWGIWGYRFANGLISTATIILILQFRRFFGSAALWAAALMALSTAFVFYSRYAIHETLFIFLQILFVYGWYLWKEEKSRKALLLMTTGVIGAFTVKETFFIFFGTWLIAWAGVHIFETHIRPTKIQTPEGERTPTQASKSEIVLILAAGIAAALALFTGFFMHGAGAIDMVRAFAFWTKTGTGASGHEKEFTYWLTLMTRYEWPALLALASVPIVFWFGDRRVRIMALTGFGTWLAYSLIAYKTPWLIMNILWPLFFVAGLALQISNGFLKRWAARLVLIFAAATSADAMLRLTFHDYANPAEPYVYVQSTVQFRTLMEDLHKAVERRPSLLSMKVLVLNQDSWPMPYTLTKFIDVSFRGPEGAPIADADVITIDDAMRPFVEAQLTGRYWRRPFQIRDAYGAGSAYLKYEHFLGLVPADTELVGPKREGAAQ